MKRITTMLAALMMSAATICSAQTKTNLNGLLRGYQAEPDVQTASISTYDYLPSKMSELKSYFDGKDAEKHLAQTLIWAKALLTLRSITQSDSEKAQDQFLAWKTVLYLKLYDYKREEKRVEDTVHSFDYCDWNGRRDNDAWLYALLHRRIRNFEKNHTGSSLALLRAYDDKWLAAVNAAGTPESRKIFLQYVALYRTNKLISLRGPEVSSVATKK